jgi:uncharacterized membrane protein
MLLFAALVGLALAGTYLPRVLFFLILCVVFVLMMAIAIGRNAWMQTRDEDPRAATMPLRRERKFSVTMPVGGEIQKNYPPKRP